jgi:hypothetical protein
MLQEDMVAATGEEETLEMNGMGVREEDRNDVGK